VRNSRLKTLGQQYAQTVADLHAMGFECICEAIGQLPEIMESVGVDPAVALLTDQGQPLWVPGMLVADVYPDVIEFRDVPLKPGVHLPVGRIRFEHRDTPWRVRDGATRQRRFSVHPQTVSYSPGAAFSLF